MTVGEQQNGIICCGCGKRMLRAGTFLAYEEPMGGFVQHPFCSLACLAAYARGNRQNRQTGT